MAKSAKLDSPASLDDRIAGAFADGATVDTVVALIPEAEAAARAAGDAAEQAASRLRERLTELQAAEEDNRRRAAYEEARAERDELAAEFARVYPPLAAQLADLLGRPVAYDPATGRYAGPSEHLALTGEYRVAGSDGVISCRPVFDRAWLPDALASLGLHFGRSSYEPGDLLGGHGSA